MIDRKAPRGRLSEWSRRLKEAFAFSEAGVLAALILFFTVMYLLSPAFRTQYNMTSILKQISTTATIAMGQTLVIISGAFDLSQGPVAGLAAMLTAISWQHWGLPVPLAICFGLGVGIACGLANGLLAARFNLHPMVMTLATATVFTGLNYFITRGYPVTRLPEGLKWLGRGQIGPFPVPILVMLLVSAIMHLMLVRTLYGRRVLQVGGNLEAARAVGIRVERTRTGIFAISGFLAALGGIMIVGRVGNALPTIGQDALFPVVTATILGGTLLSGGVGSMAGTLMGAGIMGIVMNGLVLLRFNIYLQDVVQGGLVIIALLTDQFRRGQLTWSKVIGKKR